MKKDLHLKKTLRAAIIVLLLSVAGMGEGAAQNVTVGDLKYLLQENTMTAEVKGHKDGSAATGELIIPESVAYDGSNYTVTVIRSDAFKGCTGFTGALTIPNSVTLIGESAFSGCRGFTGGLTIGNSVTKIEFEAFEGCSGLTGSLTIPNSVVEIGACAFSDCGFNGNLTLGESITIIPWYCFSGCDFTGSLLIPNSVTEIGGYAFSGCAGFSGSLIIGEAVETIGPGAFGGCAGLTYLSISENVTELGYNPYGYQSGAFEGCTGLEEIYYNPINCHNCEIYYAGMHHLTWSNFKGCTARLILGERVEKIPAYMFSGSNITGPLNMPNSITQIGNSAFYNCKELTGSLIIPNSATLIGDSVFFNCSGLNGIHIPKTVYSIGNDAFYNCHNVTELHFEAENCLDFSSTTPPFRKCGGTLVFGDGVVRIPSYFCLGADFQGVLTIPERVNKIGNSAFAGKTFTQIYYNATNCSDVSDSEPPFANCSGSVVIGEGVLGIPAFLFSGAIITQALTIPNTVLNIGSHAFYNCKKLDGELTISTSTKTIETSAFEGCSGFNGALVIPDGVTSIDDRAFAYCVGFSGTLTIPASVVSIGKDVFSGCSGLSAIQLPNTIDTIPDFAFYNCNGLVSFSIPESVQYIGRSSFQGCSGLTSIIIPVSVSTIGSEAFKNCNGLISVDINNAVIGTSMFEGCTGLSTIIIPEAVGSVGDCAFMNCSRIDSVTFNNSVISASMFEGCENLSTITIPNPVNTIGNYAFKNCAGLKEIVFNAENCTMGDGVWEGCGNIKSLTIGSTVKSIPSKAFGNLSGITSIVIPSSVESIGNRAFSNCDGVTTITIPNTLESIGEESFYGCGGLITAIIGKSVKTIGSRAFGNCSRLNMLYYNVEEGLNAANNVFSGCPNLTTIHIGTDVKEIGSNIFKGCNTVHFVVALGSTPAVLDAGAFSAIVDNSVLMVSCGNRITYFSVWNMFPFNNIIEDCDNYTIESGVVGNGGNVSLSSTEAQMGDEVQITVNPNPGMVLSSLVVCNASDPTQIIPVSPVGGKASSTFSFTMPPFGVVVMATFEKGTSVDEISNSIPVAVYPNPTNGVVSIKAEGLQRIEVYNTLGQLVESLQADGDVLECDLSRHEAGIYLIRIETASGIVTKRVVLTK